LTITTPWRLCYLWIVEVFEVGSGTWLSEDTDYKNRGGSPEGKNIVELI